MNSNSTPRSDDAGCHAGAVPGSCMSLRKPQSCRTMRHQHVLIPPLRATRNTPTPPTPSHSPPASPHRPRRLNHTLRDLQATRHHRQTHIPRLIILRQHLPVGPPLRALQLGQGLAFRVMNTDSAPMQQMSRMSKHAIEQGLINRHEPSLHQVMASQTIWSMR